MSPIRAIRTIHNWLCLGLISCLISGVATATADPTPSAALSDKSLIRIAYPEATSPFDPTYYYQSVLRLALDKTIDSHGDYELQFNEQVHSVDRMRYMIQNGKSAEVLWGSVTPERKKKLRFIPINLLRDLNNYRLLLVTENNQNAFKSVNSLESLKTLNAGNGSNWTDSRILEANGVKVITAVNYDSLIKMLVVGRFDYISRGLHEIHNDLRTYDSEPLAVNQSILLRYKHPVSYSFFVNKNNKSLADRIEHGLQVAEADGSFVALFESIPSFKIGSEELLKNREIIHLDNSVIFK